ncbi:MAG: substrate-binding domain-containing protein [Prolixibacteraceae bacterium]|jgi:accessory colonization factor AcfC
MKLILFVFVFFLAKGLSHAQKDTVYLYGPGGPYPPIKELAEIFESKNNVKIVITKGPAESWINQAKSNAHLIYSGSEFMMTDFLYQLSNEISSDDVKPLYFRKSGLLVRPGNPKKIMKLEDLLKPGLKILVINGSGLTGVWEDIMGQTRDIDQLKAMRKNISHYAKNSAEAKKVWMEDPGVDVWISWNIWQKANAALADFVELEDKYTLYRDFGVAITTNGKKSKFSQAFFNYLSSNEAKPVFKKWGWMVD